MLKQFRAFFGEVRLSLAAMVAVLLAIMIPLQAYAQTGSAMDLNLPPWPLWVGTAIGIAAHYIAKLAEESAQNGSPVNPLTYFFGRPYRLGLMVLGTFGSLVVSWQMEANMGIMTAILLGYSGDSLFNKYPGGRPEAA